MKLTNKVLLCLTLLSSISAHSGSEHNHDAPTFQPPKGGILKSIHDAHLEMVKIKNSYFLYAYTPAGKPIETKRLKISALLELPRKPSSPIIMKDKTTHWEANLETEKTHRMTIKIQIINGEEKDDVKFTFEN